MMACRVHTSTALSALGLLWLLLIVCFRLRDVAADECGTKFVDPSSSAGLAQIVFQGSVVSMSRSTRNPQIQSANITIGKVYKGMELLRRMRVSLDGAILVDRFSEEEDPDECVASMSAVKTEDQHIFFTRPTSSRGLLVMTALPLRAEHGIAQTVENSLCSTCVSPPEIQRVMCRQCARAPAIRKFNARTVIMGQKAHLRCYARGKPHPTFLWIKDGLPVTSASGDIAVRSTNTSSVLVIRKTNSAHRGQYVCRVENELGRAEEVVVLEVTNRSPVTAKPNYNVHNAPDRYVCAGGAVCLNGGTCYYSPSLDLSVCECTASYEGVKCENEATTPESGRGLANTSGSDYRDAPSKDMNTADITAGVGITLGAPESPQRTPGRLQDASHSHQSVMDHLEAKAEGILSDGRSSATTANLPKRHTRASFEEAARTNEISVGQQQTSTGGESTGASVNHAAAGRFYSNVDDQALQFILSSLQNNVLESGLCESDSFCLNGGTCQHVESLDIEICLCSKEFSGQKCEKSLVQELPPVPNLKYTIHNAPDMQTCSTNKCLNGGTCYYSSSLDLNVCECSEGFEGIKCENGITGSITAVSRPTESMVLDNDITVNDIGEESSIPGKNASMSVGVSPENVFSQDLPIRPVEAIQNASFLENTRATTPKMTTENSTTLDDATPTAQGPNLGGDMMAKSEKERSFETSERPPQTSLQKESSSASNHPAVTDDPHSNVDDETRHIHARIKRSKHKANRCRSKRYCLNGGKCRYSHELAKHFCLCRDGFYGKRCRKGSGPCESDSFCLNGGTCRQVGSLNTDICLCSKEFFGRRCEMSLEQESPPVPKPKYTIDNAPDMQTCAINKCLNGGTCYWSPSLVLGFCECPEGFEGMKCENGITGSTTAVSTESMTDNIGDETQRLYRAYLKEGILKAGRCRSKRYCMNGGKCRLSIRFGFFCVCRYGFYGKRCAERSGLCKSKRFCLNGGTCRHVQSLNTDICLCSKEFFGRRCERSLVQESPPVPNLKYTIDKAPDMWTCSINQCLNGGTCYLSPSLGISVCECAGGFDGIKCENDIPGSTTAVSTESMIDKVDDKTLKHAHARLKKSRLKAGRCRSGGYCKNGGKCRYSIRFGVFCRCRFEFYGKKCGKRYGRCKSESFCLNGGRCRHVQSRNFDFCTCPKEFFGLRCEMSLVQESSPAPKPKYTINSSPGMQTCSINKCLNGGTCYYSRFFDLSVCVCAGGFEGIKCENDITDSITAVSTESMIDKVDDKILRQAHARLKKSRLKANRCRSKRYCMNGGKCRYSRELAKHFCLCRNGFYGKRCKKRSGPCESDSFCLNGGTCRQIGSLKTGFCLCSKDFFGRRCEMSLDHESPKPKYTIDNAPDMRTCSINQCLNGGTCYWSPSLDLGFCVCNEWFTGMKCENGIYGPSLVFRKIIEDVTLRQAYARIKKRRLRAGRCKSKRYCMNGGKCRHSRGLHFTFCLCRYGFYGKRCEERSGLCKSESFCLNGGTCRHVQSLNTDICLCSKKFYGRICERSLEQESPPVPNLNYTTHNAPDRQTCSTNKCLNGGTCYWSPSLDLNVCECSEGFEGSKCENGITGSTTAVSTESMTDTVDEETLRQAHARLKMRRLAYARLIKSRRNPDRVRSGGYCLNGGTYIDSREPAARICLCRDGFYGERCTKRFGLCKSESFCLNGGTCRHVQSLNTDICLCSKTFYGRICERSLEQESPPVPNLNYTTHNSTDRQTCSINKCLNGGTCYWSPSLGISICECLEGFEGIKCENDISGSTTAVSTESMTDNIDDETLGQAHGGLKKSRLKAGRCRSKRYCKNGGKCRYSIRFGVSCHCRYGFFGKKCGKRYGRCKSESFCLNGGTCQHLQLIKINVCICPKEYIGKRCEQRRLSYYQVPERRNAHAGD